MACNPTGGYASDGNYASGGNAMGSGYYASNGSAIIYASSGDAQPYLIATSGNAQPLSPTPTPQP